MSGHLPVNLLNNIIHSSASEINLKCEIGLELVVDLVGLGLDLLHCLLHLLPRLHVRPVAVGLWTNVLPQSPGIAMCSY